VDTLVLDLLRISTNSSASKTYAHETRTGPQERVHLVVRRASGSMWDLQLCNNTCTTTTTSGSFVPGGVRSGTSQLRRGYFNDPAMQCNAKDPGAGGTIGGSTEESHCCQEEPYTQTGRPSFTCSAVRPYEGGGTCVPFSVLSGER
jgi:hypothetical protein